MAPVAIPSSVMDPPPLKPRENTKLAGNDAAHLGYKNHFTDIMAPYVERYAPNGSIASKTYRKQAFRILLRLQSLER